MTWVNRVIQPAVSIRDSRTAEEIRDGMLVEWAGKIERVVGPPPDTSPSSVTFMLFDTIAHAIVNEREEAIRRAREE